MLEDLTIPTRSQPCKVQRVVAELEGKDKEILLAAVDNPEWGFKTLEKALAQKGIVLIDTTIAAHRRRSCGCFR
jgi:hypothetical protein